MPVGIIDRIDWRVPTGPQGNVGFFISARGVRVQPQAPGQFIIADGQSGHFELDDQPDSGDWAVTGYNTGAFSHAIHVTYHWRPTGDRIERIQIIDDWRLSSAPMPSRAPQRHARRR